MARMAWITIIIASLGAAPALGCDLCGCYSAREARITKPGLYVGVFEQFTHYGTLQEDGREVDNEFGQYMDSSITQILFGCQFGDRLTLQMNLPLIHRPYRRLEGETVEEGNESGLGAVEIPRVQPVSGRDGGPVECAGRRQAVQRQQRPAGRGAPGGPRRGEDPARGVGQRHPRPRPGAGLGFGRRDHRDVPVHAPSPVLRRGRRAVRHPEHQELRLPVRQRPDLVGQARRVSGL
jgi:hypothetical protein